MIVADPLPFKEALQAQAVKVLLPTELRHDMLSTLPAALRERSLFSAGVTSGELLQHVDDGIKDILEGKKTESQVKSELERLTELTSEQGIARNGRISLIVDTQVDMARGYGQWKQTQDADVLDLYPAQEFFRGEDRKEPRFWPERWEAAGGRFFPGDSDYPDGRMIALKDDPIWEAISAFGLPYPPFDFNSGMDVRDIRRDEAEALGLIEPSESVEPEDRGFNEDLQAHPEIYEASILGSLEVFLHDIARIGGDGVLRFIGNEFDPDQPRADDGRWTATGAIAARYGLQRAEKREKGGKWLTPEGAEHAQHVQGLGIPPAWKAVQVSPDPAARLQAVGVDEAGRTQRIYSSEFVKAQSDAKFDRIEQLRSERDGIFRENTRNLSSDDPATRENAAALHVVQQLGIRPGSDADTFAKVKAYGATTLEGRHVVVDGDSVRLQFVGKKGVNIDLPVDDPKTADLLRERAQAAGANGRLFRTDAGSLRNYAHSLGTGEFKTKDFRTLKGTETAAELVRKIPNPAGTMAEYKKRVHEVAKAVAAKLGNTPIVCLQSYINPRVFSAWQPVAA